MIDINLIPISLRKGGEGGDSLPINVSKDIVLGVGGGIVILLVAVHVILGSFWLLALSRMAISNAQWQQVAPIKTELDSINKETGDLKNKITMLTGLKHTVRWAPKLNAISDALPKGIWIRKMTLGPNSLAMEGSVVSKNQTAINNVGLFLSTLKLNDAFMKDFASLDENSIQGARNNAVEVTDFSVMAKLKDEKTH